MLDWIYGILGIIMIIGLSILIFVLPFMVAVVGHCSIMTVSYFSGLKKLRKEPKEGCDNTGDKG